jgi:hypothetical protein
MPSRSTSKRLRLGACAGILHGGRPVRDIAIELKPRTAELARIASALAREDVTLRAGSALTVGGHLVARFVPSDIEAARRALDAAAVPFIETEIVPVLVESRAGELATVSARLADAGVAIRAIYLTAMLDRVMQIAIVPDNASAVRRVLGLRACL